MSYRPAIAALGFWVLAGCGFQPLYGKPGGNGVVREFAYVAVAPIRERTGQQLRSELVQKLRLAGRAPFVKYRLTVRLKESTRSLAVRKSAFATRANLTLRADYRLEAAEDGATLLEQQQQATVSYNILSSEFASLMAERDARKRAVKSLSEDIRVQLGVFFDRR